MFVKRGNATLKFFYLCFCPLLQCLLSHVLMTVVGEKKKILPGSAAEKDI